MRIAACAERISRQSHGPGVVEHCRQPDEVQAVVSQGNQQSSHPRAPRGPMNGSAAQRGQVPGQSVVKTGLRVRARCGAALVKVKRGLLGLVELRRIGVLESTGSDTKEPNGSTKFDSL